LKLWVKKEKKVSRINSDLYDEMAALVSMRPVLKKTRRYLLSFWAHFQTKFEDCNLTSNTHEKL